MECRVPWGALLLVVVVNYAASLLTTTCPLFEHHASTG